MRNFQGIVLIWTQAYREIFKYALVYIRFSGLVGLVSSCHRVFMGISRIGSFLSWVFSVSKIFLMDISWVQIFFSWVLNFFHGYSWVQFFFLEVDFVIQRFSVALCMSKSDKSRNTEIDLKPRISF